MSVTPAQIITLLPKYKLSTVHSFLKKLSVVWGPCTILKHLGTLHTEYSSVMWHYKNTPGIDLVQASTLHWHRVCAELPAVIEVDISMVGYYCDC